MRRRRELPAIGNWPPCSGRIYARRRATVRSYDCAPGKRCTVQDERCPTIAERHGIDGEKRTGSCGGRRCSLKVRRALLTKWLNCLILVDSTQKVPAAALVTTRSRYFDERKKNSPLPDIIRNYARARIRE